MQSYIGTGYPVMYFNMASRGSWYEALRHGVVDQRSALLLQPPAQMARRPTRHFIADILDLRDNEEDADVEDETKNSKHVDSGAVWTSLSPSPPSLSSNADDATTSPGSEQRSAEDLRLTTTTCRHYSAGSDSRTSDTPPSDVDVDYTSDHGIRIFMYAHLLCPRPVGGGVLSDDRRPSSVCLSVCLSDVAYAALTQKPKDLGRRNFAQGYPRSHATPIPTSRSKGQKSR